MTTSAEKAVLPAPTVAVASDGGLGYDDLVKKPNGWVQVVVGPLPRAEEGDSVTIEWEGVTVATYEMTANDLAVTFPIAVANAKINAAGDGDKTLSYTATYAHGASPEFSKSVTIKVKRDIPGDLDPYPDTAFNDNLLAITVDPHPVPPNATSVQLHARRWLNAAAGDVLTLSCNGVRFDAPPLTTPLPDEVTVVLTAAQILEAGVGPAIPITWGVYDIVDNWSAWAPVFVADVPIDDPAALAAPRVGNAVQGWTLLDLNALGTDNVSVYTPVYQGSALNDMVTVYWNGTTATGESLTHVTSPQPMTDNGRMLQFDIPNDKATALAGGSLRVSYKVKRVTGGEDVPSKRAYLTVSGAGVALPVPYVHEEKLGTLDPNDTNPNANTEIFAYVGMALHDTVVLVWEGTAGNGTPARITQEQKVGTVGQSLHFLTPRSDVLRFLDGNADVYYIVTPRVAHGRRIVRALTDRESEHLHLSVRVVPVDLVLPRPEPDFLQDGKIKLSQISVATGLRVVVPQYQGMALGQTIALTCISAHGNHGPVSATVNTIGNVELFIPYAFVKTLLDELMPALAGFEYVVTPPGGEGKTSPITKVTFVH